MKKPLDLLLSRKSLALLLLLAAATIYCIKNVESIHFLKEIATREGFEEHEENEDPAEAYGPMDYWGQQRSYPSGDISAKAYMDAFEHMQRMPKIENKVSAQSRVEQTNWTPLGPMNFAGRVLSLAFHPTNANILWAGTCGGGLWKTTSGGTGAAGGINWTQVSTGFPITSVPAIAVNPTNASEIFIGTGEVYSKGGNGFTGQDTRTFRGSYGIGVLKTSDGGTTWTQSLPFTGSSVDGVYEIKYAPGNPSIIFAGTSNGLYRTTNSGTSWTQIFSTPLVMDFEFVPTDPNRLLISVGDLGSAGTGIYKSYNALSATPTFTQITSGLPAVVNGMIRLSFPADKPNKVFASVGKTPGTSTCTAPCNFGLYTSSDTGNTWTKPASQPTLPGGTYIQNQGWYAHDVLAAPVSNNSIWVSEIDMTRSTNGGGTWAKVSDWGAWDLGASGGTTVGDPTEGGGDDPTYVHADHHHIYLSPHDPSFNTIWVVCDGGVFKSADGGSNWTSCNGGLMTAQIYHNMSIHPSNPSLMLCGLQDNATLYYQGSTGCRRVTGGDGFYTNIDQSNANYCYATYSYGTWYRSTTGLGGFGGSTWSNATLAGTSTPTEYAAFVAPVVLSNNGATLYVGTNLLRKFTSPRTSTANTVGNGGNPISGPTNSIMAIAVVKSFSDSIYLSTAPGGGNPGRMYRSANGGTAVTNISTGLPDRYFSSIAIDPTNSKRVAITVAGFGTGHVYLTTNGGASWNNITGTGGTALPDVPTNIVMFEPNDPTTLYIGNDLGVFAAPNVTTGATAPAWYSYNNGWTDVTPVMDLLATPGATPKIRAGTFGKGLWENNLAQGLPVTFESFTVSPTNNGNQVKWVIGTQENVSHYEVEYSTDMVNFATVASLPARTGTTHLTYSFVHKISNNTNGYYRIKVVDLDGSVMYSQIEQVKAEQLVASLSTYPNPTLGIVTVKIPTTVTGKFYLKLYDVVGKLVLSNAIQVSQGMRETQLDITRFASGTYQLVGQDDKSRFVTRIVKR